MRVSGNEIKALKEILDTFKTTKPPTRALVTNSINELHSESPTSDFQASPIDHIEEDEIWKLQDGNTPTM